MVLHGCQLSSTFAVACELFRFFDCPLFFALFSPTQKETGATRQTAWPICARSSFPHTPASCKATTPKSKFLMKICGARPSSQENLKSKHLL
jgi:hypothetical protein